MRSSTSAGRGASDARSRICGCRTSCAVPQQTCGPVRCPPGGAGRTIAERFSACSVRDPHLQRAATSPRRPPGPWRSARAVLRAGAGGDLRHWPPAASQPVVDAPVGPRRDRADRRWRVRAAVRRSPRRSAVRRSRAWDCACSRISRSPSSPRSSSWTATRSAPWASWPPRWRPSPPWPRRRARGWRWTTSTSSGSAAGPARCGRSSAPPRRYGAPAGVRRGRRLRAVRHQGAGRRPGPGRRLRRLRRLRGRGTAALGLAYRRRPADNRGARRAGARAGARDGELRSRRSPGPTSSVRRPTIRGGTRAGARDGRS
jgi:hypothetical protein